MNNKTIIAALILIVAAGGVSLLVRTTRDGGQRVCTMEAKQCPDGSYVGRTGPDCEFAPCPDDDQSGWQTAPANADGITFRYPKDFGTTYIKPVDWPPSVRAVDEPFSCTEAGTETAQAGKTEERIIGGSDYCVTVETEGAAGSTYHQYAYATSKGDGGTWIMTFTTRQPQCGNYDEPQRRACEKEEADFDVDALVGSMMKTLTPQEALKSGIKGTVILGPHCPVIREGQEGCEDTLYQTPLVLTKANDSRAIKTFSSREDGTFSLEASPGEYMIYDGNASVLPECATRNPVVVTKGSYTETTVYCDSGIR